MREWLFAALVSIILCVTLWVLLVLIMVGGFAPMTQGRGLFVVGIGSIVASVIWPGILTVCLILFSDRSPIGVQKQPFSHVAGLGLSASIISGVMLATVGGAMNTLGRVDWKLRAIGGLLAVLSGPTIVLGYYHLRKGDPPHQQNGS